MEEASDNMQELSNAVSHVAASLQKYEEEEQTQQYEDLGNMKQAIPRIGYELEKVQAIVEDRQKHTKEKMNILAAVGKWRLENRHSNIIAYLIDPQQKHYCGEMFLRLFCETMQEWLHTTAAITANTEEDNSAGGETGKKENGKEEAETAKQAAEKFQKFIKDGFDYRNAEIKREAYVAGRKIDILITSGNKALFIENKIWAKDQHDQMIDYFHGLKNDGYKDVFGLYLSPYRHKPSKDSVTKEGDSDASEQETTELVEEGKHYAVIGYSDIVEWLDRCMKASYKHAHVVEQLKRYITVIRNELFGGETDMDMNKKMVELLTKEKNVLLLKYLHAGTVVQVRDFLRFQFFNQLEHQLTAKLGRKWKYVESVNKKIDLPVLGYPENFGMTCDELEDTCFNFYIQVQGYDYLFCGIWIGNDNTDTEKVQKIKNAFQAKEPVMDINNEYWCGKKIPIIDHDNNPIYKFFEDHLNYCFATNMGNIVTETIDQITPVFEAWKEIRDELNF